MKAVSKMGIKALPVAACLLILIASTAGVMAYQPKIPADHAPSVIRVQDNFNKLVVENSQMVIWFQGFKPMLHVFKRGTDGNVTGFTVDVRNVFELNSSNVPDAVLPLTRAYPFFVGNAALNYSSGVSVTYDNTTDMVNITFTLTAEEYAMAPFFNGSREMNPQDVPMMPVRGIGEASVAIVFHVNATTAHVKFDFIVNKWTWENTTSDRLALDVMIVGHEIVKGPRGMKPTLNGTVIGNDNHDNQGRNNQDNDNAVEASMDRVAIVGQNFLNLGYITWGKEANATYWNGTTTAVTVSVIMFNHGFTEDSFGFNNLLFVFTPPAGWARNYTTLVYDPTISLGQGTGGSSFISPSIAIIASALAVAVAGAAVIAVRRRK